MKKFTLPSLFLLLLPSIVMAADNTVYLIAVNNIGFWLLLLGITLMILELFIFTFGIISSAGVIAFIIGMIILFGMPGAVYPLPWPLIALICLLAIAFFALVTFIVIQSHRKKTMTGLEGLIGCEGFVLHVQKEKFTVRVLGEIWEANSSDLLHVGDKVKVTKVRGLVLTIKPIIKGE